MVTALRDLQARSPFVGEEPAVECPHRYFRELREEAPVHFEPSIDAWVVTSDAEIRRVIKDVSRFSNRRATGPVTARRLAQAVAELVADGRASTALLARLEQGTAKVLIDADPPVHRRQREAVGGGFTPAAVAPLEGEVMEIADRLIDAFVEDGHCEVVTQFSRALPMRVIANQLGVGDGDLATFIRWSDAFTEGLGNHHVDSDRLLAALAAQAEFYDYFTDRLADAARHPADDILSLVATAEVVDGEPLAVAEQLQMCAQFVVAGNETTAKAVAMAVKLLAENEELQEGVRAEPALAARLVEEVLRLESPTQGMFRTALEDVSVGGVDIPTGQHLFLVYAAANRDPARFDDPDVLRLDRPKAAQHLGFGAGEHFCLGAHLARLEAKVAVQRLLDRVRDIRLDNAAPTRWEQSYFLHGLLALPITFSTRDR